MSDKMSVMVSYNRCRECGDSAVNEESRGSYWVACRGCANRTADRGCIEDAAIDWNQDNPPARSMYEPPVDYDTELKRLKCELLKIQIETAKEELLRFRADEDEDPDFDPDDDYDDTKNYYPIKLRGPA